MRQLHIQGVTRRRFRTGTTRRAHGARPAPDLVGRDFSVDGPDRLWLTDITQMRTGFGWLYLAVVLDAWSRRIVGWEMASHMRTELVVHALKMAITRRQPRSSLALHSDSEFVGIGFLAVA